MIRTFITTPTRSAFLALGCLTAATEGLEAVDGLASGATIDQARELIVLISEGGG